MQSPHDALSWWFRVGVWSAGRRVCGDSGAPAPHFHLMLSWVKLWDWEIYRCGHWMFHILQPFLAKSPGRCALFAPPVLEGAPSSIILSAKLLFTWTVFFWGGCVLNKLLTLLKSQSLYWLRLSTALFDCRTRKNKKKTKTSLGIMELDNEMQTSMLLLWGEWC